MPFPARLRLKSKKSVPDLHPPSGVSPLYTNATASKGSLPSTPVEINSPSSPAFTPLAFTESPSPKFPPSGGGFSKFFGWTRSPNIGSGKPKGTKTPTLAPSPKQSTPKLSKVFGVTSPMISRPIAAFPRPDQGHQCAAELPPSDFYNPSPAATTVVDDYAGGVSLSHPPASLDPSHSVSTIATSQSLNGGLSSTFSFSTISSIESDPLFWDGERVWDSASSIASFSEASSRHISPHGSLKKGMESESEVDYRWKTGLRPVAIKTASKTKLPIAQPSIVITPPAPKSNPLDLIDRSTSDQSLPFDPEFERAASVEYDVEVEDETPRLNHYSSNALLDHFTPATSHRSIYDSSGSFSSQASSFSQGSSRIPTMCFEKGQVESLLSEVLKQVEGTNPYGSNTSMVESDSMVGLGLCYHETVPLDTTPQLANPPKRNSSVPPTHHRRTSSSSTVSTFSAFLAGRTEQRESVTPLRRSSSVTHDEVPPLTIRQPLKHPLPSLSVIPPTPVTDGNEGRLEETFQSDFEEPGHEEVDLTQVAKAEKLARRSIFSYGSSHTDSSFHISNCASSLYSSSSSASFLTDESVLSRSQSLSSECDVTGPGTPDPIAVSDTAVGLAEALGKLAMRPPLTAKRGFRIEDAQPVASSDNGEDGLIRRQEEGVGVAF